MSPPTTPWDDTGFDADDEGGFKGSPPLQEVPTPAQDAVQETPAPQVNPPQVEPPKVEPPHVEPPHVEPPHVEPPSVVPPEAGSPRSFTRVGSKVPPPPVVEERRSKWGTAFLVTALLLIILAVGFIVSTFFMRDPTDQEAFYANPDAVEPAPTSQAVAPTQAPPMPEVTTDSISTDTVVHSLADASVPKKMAREPKEAAPSKPATPPTKPTPANALFVVQVFSSPSRDDADEWLQMLREKNVSDGFITEQRIGGEAWYRVRFGQYNTRQDAESAAQQHGFSNPWIARVR